ncbi:MAG: carbamoyltransferase [Saprospiraceae bacterium]|nr:carbamoyltransferase [Saprospiraceae bacterium]
MKILGISAYYHDSAAAIIGDGQVLAAAQEERFTRIKHDPGFPTNAIRFCLSETGFSLNNLDAVVFYDKPLLKFERLLDTYYGFAPKGVSSFVASMPVWVNEKLMLKRNIRRALSEIEVYDRKKWRLYFPEHHLSHAASSFYPSRFEEAAILTIDGVGEWATASIGHGKGSKIKVLREMHFPHSLGLLYSAFTYFLGFRVNSGEYKLMGLAPYGNPDGPGVQRFGKTIREKLVKLKPDGSLWLDQQFFRYATGLRMTKDQKWETLFGFPRRNPEDELEQHHCDLAWAIQNFTEEVVVAMAKEAKRLTGADHLCMAGGVALNCVANGKLELQNIFKEIYIQPAAGDAGGALGAALAVHHIVFDRPREIQLPDGMQGSFLGPEYSDLEIQRTARKYDAPCTHFSDFNQLTAKLAKLLNQGKILGWFQGRMEFGPRALGGRSILGDPRNSDMQKTLNLKIKYRESFRPFAPSVLEESASSFFDLPGKSPYMLLVHPVKQSQRKQVPENYLNLPLREKLYTLRSEIPAVTHIDFSARIQTVSKETNPRYHQLLSAFEQETGCGMLVNTSFNVRGEPIVCTPEDAYRCFMRTEMDYLVLGNFLFDKREQPKWDDTDHWQETFKLD